jgi:antitoxin ParD1/3/4
MNQQQEDRLALSARRSFLDIMLVEIKMRLNLKPATEQLIKEKVDSGRYSSPSHVVEAALATLEQEERLQFEPEEIRRLIAEGEASGTIDGPSSLKKRRERRAARRKKQ